MKKAHVRETALRMAEEMGLVNISQAALSRRAGIAPGSFVHIVGCKFSEFMDEIAEDVPVGRIVKSKKRRAVPGLRRQQLIAAGVQLAVEYGYDKITRHQIAQAADVAPGLVTYYLGGIEKARDAVLCEAVRIECLPVIVQAVVRQSPLMDEVDERLKRRALKSLDVGI